MSCPSCRRDFYARDSRQIYCSASCRVTACRRRNQQRVADTRTEREQWQAKHWLPDPLPAPPPWRHHEVPVAVITHPKRLDHALDLAQEATAEAVVVDDRHYGCDVNHLRAWEWLAGGNCPWSVVLEDDAIPVRRFRFQLHAALAAAPTPIVSLYLGRSRPPHWQRSIAETLGAVKLRDACFLTATELLHGVGYAIRTALLPDLLYEVPHLIRGGIPIDEAIGEWARRRDYAISYTWPSLVDHRDENSLINHPDGQQRMRGRVAWCADWREKWTPTVADIADPVLETLKEIG